MNLRPALLLSLLAAVLAISASCGGGGDGASSGGPLPGATPGKKAGAPAGGAGALIITKPQGLVEYGIDAKSSKPLITPAQESTFLLDPALSADGKLLAYVLQPPPRIEGKTYDAGSDLWVANRDGSNQHAVFTHSTPNQLVRFPQWEDAGHILAVVQEISLVDGATRVVYVLERIDAATGERVKVLEDVLAFGISPDGKRAVYAHLAPETGETLDVVELASGERTTLIGIDQQLSPFNSPRYSPDGGTIAFASADQTGARARLEYVSARGFGPPRAPATDGLPEDIWLIDAGGGPARRAADLKEDLPALAWGGDGDHIYVLGASALYDVNLVNGAVVELGEGSFHGQLVWAP